MKIQIAQNSKISLDNILSIKNKLFYEYYKKNRKKISKNIPREYTWGTCLNTLLLSLQKLILEKEGGVVINDIGYFCYIMLPKKSRRLSFIKSKYIYKPHFFGFENFKFWTFQSAFDISINRHNSTGNKKRELHYSLFNNLKIRL
jgi:hypothetical protein